MLHIIYNPTAGRGKAQAARPQLEEMLKEAGRPCTFHPTGARGHAREIAAQLSDAGETEIIAMGGDGTLHEVVNGYRDLSRLKLGILPCGSGNDFAAALGLPGHPREALRLMLSASAIPTDYLVCSGIRCINVLGAGIDVEVLRRSYRAKLLSGSLNYAVSLLGALVRFENMAFSLSLNGRESRHSGFLVCACNGRRIGGGIEICPDAVVDDGCMDVVLVNGLPRRSYPGALLKLARKQILQQPYTLHERSTSLKVEFLAPATLQIDGELYDGLPFDVRTVHGELRIYRK